jgi:hypothetical protein
LSTKQFVLMADALVTQDECEMKGDGTSELSPTVLREKDKGRRKRKESLKVKADPSKAKTPTVRSQSRPTTPTRTLSTRSEQLGDIKFETNDKQRLLSFSNQKTKSSPVKKRHTNKTQNTQDSSVASPISTNPLSLSYDLIQSSPVPYVPLKSFTPPLNTISSSSSSSYIPLPASASPIPPSSRSTSDTQRSDNPCIKFEANPNLLSHCRICTLPASDHPNIPTRRRLVKMVTNSKMVKALSIVLGVCEAKGLDQSYVMEMLKKIQVLYGVYGVYGVVVVWWLCGGCVVVVLCESPFILFFSSPFDKLR